MLNLLWNNCMLPLANNRLHFWKQLQETQTGVCLPLRPPWTPTRTLTLMNPPFWTISTLTSILKWITTFPIQKLWMNREVHLLLKACNTAFRSGDQDTGLPFNSLTAKTGVRRMPSVRQPHLLNPQIKHWRLTGLCAESFLLLPLHLWLHGSNTIVKFAENTTLVGLTNNNDDWNCFVLDRKGLQRVVKTHHWFSTPLHWGCPAQASYC